MSDEHRPARWSGPGKRSVQARSGSKGQSATPPEPVEAPETGTSIEVDASSIETQQPAERDPGTGKPGD